MSTNLLNIESRDYYENKKEISLTSFYGGEKRGIMLDIKLRHLEGLKSEMGIELNKDQAIALAKAILEKFDQKSSSEEEEHDEEIGHIPSDSYMFCQHGGNADDCIVCNPETGWNW